MTPRSGVSAVFGALMFSAVLSAADCSVIVGLNRESFAVRVDSISGPSVTSGRGFVVVLFWGTIGPDLCHGFKRFDTRRTGQRVDVAVIGERIAGANLGCGAAIAELRGKALRIEPVTHELLTIVAHQPDGTTLERVIRPE